MSYVYYLQNSANGIHQISLKTKLLEKRIIYLDRPVDSESVNEIIQQISLLATEAPGESITMVINSPGGSIQDGLVLIDVMRSYDGIIKTVSLGMAASMAAVILAAGTKGHRYISPHSQVMLHQPLIGGGLAGGNCSEIEGVAKSLLARKKQIDDMLVDFTERPRKDILKLTSTDTYLNAQQAKDNGLIDVIADGKTLFELIGGDT